jgi:hypothetical protein
MPKRATSAPEPTGDPYWSNVVLLLRGEGTDGSGSVYDDVREENIKTSNQPTISTTQYKYGSASLYGPGTGVYTSAPAMSSLNIGTGDWTIECWARTDTVSLRYIFMHPHTSGYAGGG